MCLLGRHVRDRSENAALGGLEFGGQNARAVGTRRDGREFCETEIEDLDPPRVLAVAQHDVGGLEIAVGDTFLMRRRDRVDQRNRDSQQMLDRHAGSRDRVCQRTPLHQLHRQEQRAAVGRLNREERDDIGVVQAGNELSFTLQPLPALGIECDRDRNELEGDDPAQSEIPGFVDFAHAAGSDGTENLVRAEPSPRS